MKAVVTARDGEHSVLMWKGPETGVLKSKCLDEIVDKIKEVQEKGCYTKLFTQVDDGKEVSTDWLKEDE